MQATKMKNAAKKETKTRFVRDCVNEVDQTNQSRVSSTNKDDKGFAMYTRNPLMTVDTVNTNTNRLKHKT